jgi:serine carboxypeptidase 1
MCCDTIVACMSGDRFAQAAENEMIKGNFTNATLIWADMEEAVLGLTDNVDFYNLLQHETSSDSSFYGTSLEKTAARHLRVTQTTNLTQVMNGPVRKKLGIIPSTVSWSQSSGAVFGAFVGDFMKDTISQVCDQPTLEVIADIFCLGIL